MPTNFRPSFTDNVSVVAAAVLARGDTTRGTIDLRSKIGAYLFFSIGRGGTTAISGGTSPAGVQVRIRPVLNNDIARAGVGPNNGIPQIGSTPAATSTTVDADSNSGQATLNVATTTGYAAEDDICIQDSGGGVTRLEFAKISKITNPGVSGELVLDRNLRYTHTAVQADTVRNKSDVFNETWLRGGSLWEVIFDYGDETAGESVTVVAVAQTYDNDTDAAP